MQNETNLLSVNAAQSKETIPFSVYLPTLNEYVGFENYNDALDFLCDFERQTKAGEALLRHGTPGQARRRDKARAKTA